MNYIIQIDSSVAGIPCIIGVKNFDSVPGSYSYNADSDMDFYGYIESEWEVLDRRGRPAPWLMSKMTNEDQRRIDLLIKGTLD